MTVVGVGRFFGLVRRDRLARPDAHARVPARPRLEGALARAASTTARSHTASCSAADRPRVLWLAYSEEDGRVSPAYVDLRVGHRGDDPGQQHATRALAQRDRPRRPRRGHRRPPMSPTPTDALPGDRSCRRLGGDHVKLKGPCARCGSDRIVPVVFGYPSLEMEAASARGEFLLGGDALYPDVLHNNVGCADCRHRWHDPLVAERHRPPLRPSWSASARGTNRSLSRSSRRS